MSNYLAIATVTAALQSLLVEHVSPDMVGVDITTKRPEAPAGDISGPSINIYMYQATPNQAWRNKDIRTRRPKGDLVKHGLAALDLNYLFSFYGDESQLVPQRLLGSAVRTLVDYPLLTHEMIRNCLTRSEVANLEETTLEDQVQLVRFIPGAMTTEDLSRIWSTFFQVPYSLSFAYQATAVLIQGNRAGKASLPVRRRVAAVTQNRPIIERIDPQPIEQPITAASSLVIKGRQLTGYSRTVLTIGNCELTPHETKDTQILLRLSELSPSEIEGLRAGVQGLQIVQMSQAMIGMGWTPTVESNVVPVVFCPRIMGGNDGIRLLEVKKSLRNRNFSGVVGVKLDVTVGLSQRAYLMLNRIDGEGGETYIFRTERRYEETKILEFNFSGVDAGEFLVRVQIDGAESPLVDDGDRYTGPSLVIEARP